MDVCSGKIFAKVFTGAVVFNRPILRLGTTVFGFFTSFGLAPNWAEVAGGGALGSSGEDPR